MSEVKVSIVVPIYNLEKYVPRCLDALVNQTLEEIEILCVDDGSKDSAPQIIEDYKAKYPNKVKTFHKENGGEWSARTYGLKQAIGEYVGFIDSDDVPEVTWAEKLYEAAKKNGADIAFSGYDRVDLDTGKTVSVEMTQYGTMNKEVDFNDDFIVYANPSLWNKIYRREIVKDLEFLPFRGCNDTLFLIHSYMSGVKKLTFIPDVLYHYYLRSSSQIHSLNTNVERLAVNMETMLKIQGQQGERLDELEQRDELNTLNTNIEKITLNVENAKAEQEKQRERLEILENRDGEMWRKVTGYLLTAVVGIIIGFLFKQIGI